MFFYNDGSRDVSASLEGARDKARPNINPPVQLGSSFVHFKQLKSLGDLPRTVLSRISQAVKKHGLRNTKCDLYISLTLISLIQCPFFSAFTEQLLSM